MDGEDQKCQPTGDGTITHAELLNRAESLQADIDAMKLTLAGARMAQVIDALKAVDLQ